MKHDGTTPKESGNSVLLNLVLTNSLLRQSVILFFFGGGGGGGGEEGKWLHLLCSTVASAPFLLPCFVGCRYST